MSTPVSLATTISTQGVLDHARAEALAARLRAAVRNGRSTITVSFAAGTVLASPSLLAFLVRAGEVLVRQGGHLDFTGDPAVLAQLQALGIAPVSVEGARS